MIGVFIIPTGLEAEIGGHAGDANPAAKLIASCCDKLIIHPNVVNASDVNEMSENMLYVEGSILDRFLAGDIKLKQPTFQNRILVVGNPPLKTQTINAVASGRVTIGLNAEVLELRVPLLMEGWVTKEGIADGHVEGYNELIEQVQREGDYFDAVALHTPIDVKREIALNYFKVGGVNPWGKVESMASRSIADALDVPVAHAPVDMTDPDTDPELFAIYNTILDPRKAPEAISICYLHCVLKGLNRAPRISKSTGLSIEDVDFLITPDSCYGLPHKLCEKADIPIIVVTENKTLGNSTMSEHCTFVENYWEAAGYIMALKNGIHPSSVRRPIEQTEVIYNMIGD